MTEATSETDLVLDVTSEETSAAVAPPGPSSIVMPSFKASQSASINRYPIPGSVIR